MVVRAVVAFAAAAALFLVGLVTPGAEAAGPFPFSDVSEIQFVTTDLCDMGTLGTAISDVEAMSHATPKFVNITDVGRCISTRSLNAPPITDPENADAKIDSELFNYGTVGTSTGYGTKLMANITNVQAVPFDMSVDATTGAAASGDVVAGSEVFTYDSKTATTFHITARAQRASTAANHNGGNSNVNQERVYATPASGKTSSFETTLSAAITMGAAPPFDITVASTSGASGTCGGPPCVLLIDTERFTYDSKTATTFHITARGSTKSTIAAHSMGAAVLAPREPPFELEVGDARVETGFDADSPNNAATGTSHFLCFSNETLEYNPSAAETVGDGLGGGADVIYVVARGLDRIGGEECGLITPRAKEAQHHAGSSIRDATRVQLMSRALPEYDGGTTTAMAAHSVSTAIGSAPSFNRCIGRSDREIVSGPDNVTSRTRCYSRLINQPSPPGSEDGSGPYFVSTNALTDPFTFISQSTGTFNDETDGVVQTKLNIFSLGQCITVGSLHVEVRTILNVDKTAGDTDYGSFNIRVWLNNTTCSGTPNYIVGENDELSGQPNGTNFSATPLATDSDIDKDGCTDYREVGGNNLAFPVTGQDLGGQRDPFNPYDYYDINHDGAVNVVVDILGVAAAFGTSHPRYVDYKNRGSPIYGPFSWNRRAPANENINVVDDILGVAAQFGHNCPHTTHPATTVFGAHPTTVSVKVTAAQLAPFDMSVASTAGFAASGQLLVGAETLSYDSKTATSFHITARGDGIPAGDDPAQMPVSAIVYPKP